MQILTDKLRQPPRALRRISLFALLNALLLVCVQASAQEVTTENVRSQPSALARKGETEGQSTIRGRVVFDDTGRPVRRALVMLFTNLKHPAVRRTVANRRGEFRFASLKAGTYFVVADAPGALSLSSGFQISEMGLTSEGADEYQVSVSDDGKKEAQVEVRIRKGGVITGKVTYSDNEPVLGGRVVLFRRRGNGSVRFFTDPVVTDDRGVYRVEGLPSGEYLVGVIEKSAVDNRIAPGERPALIAAYYPAAKSFQGAKTVQVTAGSETGDVNIKLAEDNLRRIAGRVVWRSTGQPAEGAALILRREDDPSVDVSILDLLQNITAPNSDRTSNMLRNMSLSMLMMNTTPSTMADAKGYWKFADLPDGRYLLTAVAALPAKGSASPDGDEQSEIDKKLPGVGRRLVTQRVEVTVGDNDETDLKIELSEGARVSGAIVAEEGTAPIALIMVQYEGAHPLLNLPYYSNKDGTFLLEGVPAGEVRLDVRLPPDSNYYVKSVSAGDVDLLRAPLRVTEGVELSNVRVTLARGRATLSGRITASEGGAPAGGAGVLLVPVDERLWPARGARTFGRANAEGVYSVTVAPGDYIVFTWSPRDETAQSIDEFIRARLATAPRISLQPGESKKADLTVNAQAAPDKRE